MIEQIQEELVSKNTDFSIPIAKGVGNPSEPINLIGSMVVEGGEYITSFSGYDTIMITEQCGVSINNTPVVVFPERTSFKLDDVTSIMFDRKVIVCKLIASIVMESGVINGISYVKFADGTMILYGHAVLEERPPYTHVASVRPQFPIHFTGPTPSVSASLDRAPSSGDVRENVLSVNSINYTQTIISYISSTSINLSTLWGIEVSWQAIGRWK